MNDRELLEMAAKEAGYQISEYVPTVLGGPTFRNTKPPILYCRDGGVVRLNWNPLTDDGDALRLAVKLGINPIVNWDHKPGAFSLCQEQRLAATRRAIVRAAAEVGKGMRPFPTAEEIRESWI